MKNIHIYILPIAIGLLGLLASPIADVTGIAYGLVVVSMVLGIVGLRSIAQSNMTQTQLFQQSNEILHQKLETLIASNQQIIEEEKKSRIALEETTTRSQGILEEMHDTTKNGQLTLSKQLLEIEEKLEDSRVVMTSLGKLMIEEITEAIKTASSELAEEIDKVLQEQDSLSKELMEQQNDLSDVIEERFGEMNNELENQKKHAEDTTEKINQTIATGIESSTQVIDDKTNEFMMRTNQFEEFTKEQYFKIEQIFKEVEQLSQSVKLQNEQQNRIVEEQLKQLSEISPALVEGVAQLTDSKSPERKHLLKIQKNMIAKFADLTS
ncbi:hypothetical protein ACRPK8_02960 [Exiguobacterium sp. TDN 0502]|uniref:hypothetical protein n=1 Tax=Exiguobacterium sp. TDN 0502 TaxID=3420731 RepID=UPI003D774EB4